MSHNNQFDNAVGRVDNPITEEWKGLHGYDHYNAVPAAQAIQLRKQNHVNIRSFFGDLLTTNLLGRPVYMLFLDSLTMDDLADIKMTALDAQVTVREGEQWSVGTWARDASRKNWNVLSITCTANVPSISYSLVVD